MVFFGFRSESSKRVSCMVRNPALGCFSRLHGARDSFPKDTRSLLALFYNTLGHFGSFDSCTRLTGPQS